jgi:hypothetical protein
LLFIGSDRGVYVSIDGGIHWITLADELPPVRVDDMLIHPRETDLVIGTHGRGIYTLDIAPLQEMTQEVINVDAHLFKIQPATLFHLDITKNKGVRGARWFSAQNPYAKASDLLTIRYVLGENGALAPPGGAIYYYLKKDSTEPLKITILDQKTEQFVRVLKGPTEKGINRVIWDLRKSPIALTPTDGGNDAVRLRESGLNERSGPFVEPGQYRVRLSIGKAQFEQTLLVEADESLKF